MKIDTLTALSPLDGRYNLVTHELRQYFSEYALIKYRIKVEIKWFIHLSKDRSIKDLPKLSIKDNLYLTDLINKFETELIP